MKKLTRDEMKNVKGGTEELSVAGGACDSCTQLCHSNNDSSYGYGMCSSSTGGSSCHNYCCASSQTYWC